VPIEMVPMLHGTRSWCQFLYVRMSEAGSHDSSLRCKRTRLFKAQRVRLEMVQVVCVRESVRVCVCVRERTRLRRSVCVLRWCR